MKHLKIETGANNPILRTKSKEVREFDTSLKKLAAVMKKTMKNASGLGLAAPQVGKNLRIVLVTLNYKRKNETVVAMVNPEIVATGEDLCMGEEGCLSLPGHFDKVLRHCEITVRFFDLDGNPFEMQLSGLDAREVQHEIDHLDGVLFVDRMEERSAENAVIEASREVI